MSYHKILNKTEHIQFNMSKICALFCALTSINRVMQVEHLSRDSFLFSAGYVYKFMRHTPRAISCVLS